MTKIEFMELLKLHHAWEEVVEYCDRFNTVPEMLADMPSDWMAWLLSIVDFEPIIDDCDFDRLTADDWNYLLERLPHPEKYKIYRKE